MRLSVIIVISACILSCDSESVHKNKSCQLTNGNAIPDLKSDGIAQLDSLEITFGDDQFSLKTLSSMASIKFYDYIMDRKTVSFGKEASDVKCLVRFYYPGDSS